MVKSDCDIVVIGAGMSGLAATIRASMLGKKVFLFEKHVIAGGLNSFYSRGRRDFDVGLHALTNFAKKGGKKGLPLLKILRQLRINYDALNLQEHRYSKILFRNFELTFSNEHSHLWQQVREKFPGESLAFEKLWEFIEDFPDDNLYGDYQSTRDFLKTMISSPLLAEMILSPCLIYGSAVENDMDLGQFIIMFRALFMEGLSRPKDGIRHLIQILINRCQEEGASLHFGKEIVSIDQSGSDCHWIVQLKNGRVIKSKEVISTIGHKETLGILKEEKSLAEQMKESEDGQMSFTETILVTRQPIPRELEGAAIVFYNGAIDDIYRYQKPDQLFSDESAVICFPDNYGDPHHQDLSSKEGTIRITFMANYHLWNNLSRKDYLAEKENVYQKSCQLLEKLYPSFHINEQVVFKDVFTPKTIFRYTGHKNGAVYGSPKKLKDGKIEWNGEDRAKSIALAGTDQGFLGVVGSMLSGLVVASNTCTRLGL